MALMLCYDCCCMEDNTYSVYTQLNRLVNEPAGGLVTVGRLRRSLFDVIGNDGRKLFLKDQLFLKTGKEVLFPGSAGDTCT